MLKKLTTALIFVLMLASSASAEWILWRHFYGVRVRTGEGVKVDKPSWGSEGTFSTYNQCYNAKKNIWNKLVAHYTDKSQLREKIPYEYILAKHIVGSVGNIGIDETFTNSFHCLPASLDPQQR